MAPLTSPQTPSFPPPAKRNVFGLSSTNRRQSTSGQTGGPPLAVAASPQQPTTPAGSGIPSFRGALRSLLPFGNNSKNTPSTPAPAPYVPPTPTQATPRASFGFNSVRRSMHKERERKMSLNESTMPLVLTIERSKSDSFADDGNVRRSVSLSRLDEPLQSEPLGRALCHSSVYDTILTGPQLQPSGHLRPVSRFLRNCQQLWKRTVRACPSTVVCSSQARRRPRHHERRRPTRATSSNPSNRLPRSQTARPTRQ